MIKRAVIFILLVIFASSLVAAPGIYLNKARTMKQKSLMVRTYYGLANMETEVTPMTTDLYAHTAILFASYGLTDNITIGTNLFYVYKDATITTPIITREISSYGMDDIVNLIKIGILKNKTSFLSLAISTKWNSAFYTSSDTMPQIGTNGTDINIKVLYDIKVSDIWFTLIPSYTYSLTENNGITNNSARFIITSSFPVWNNTLFGEADIDIDYGFSTGDATADNSLFYKGLLGFQYKLSKKVFAQILGGYGKNDDDTQTFKYLRTGFSMNF